MNNPFLFHWIINDHSLLPDGLEANFFIEYPSVTGWTLLLRPIPRKFVNRKYECHLRCDTRYEPRRVTVERLDAYVTCNGLTVIRESPTFDMTFTPEVNGMFLFPIEIEECDFLLPNLLHIHVAMTVRGENDARVEGNSGEMPLLWGGSPEDRLDLISKLKDCLLSDYHTTMTINRFNVHHYILKRRWTNFFEIHDLDHNSAFVALNVTDQVLMYVLSYMYTGILRAFWAVWSHYRFTVELFQVILNYRIFHMFNAFTQSRSIVVLSSGFESVRMQKTLKFSFREYIHMKPHSFTVLLNPSNRPDQLEDIFLFSTNARRAYRCCFWLSYSFLSQTRKWFMAQVSMKMEIEGKWKLVHYKEFKIAPNARFESGPILFLGCRSTFGRALARPYKLTFNIRFSDGTNSYNYDVIPKADPHKWMLAEDLYSHMCDILRENFRPDLFVRLKGDRHDKKSHPLHKAIFGKRVPEWWNVVHPPVPPAELVPDRITLPLSNASFNSVVSYIYTGKLPEVPVFLRDEILQFAINGRFESLQNLMLYHLLE